VDAEAACDAVAADQHGVVSRRQALDAGLTPRMIERRVSSGRWRVVLPGVYVLRPVPPSWHQRLTAAVLSGGPLAVVSHRSAAALWELDGFEGQPVEISVTTGQRVAGAVVHRRRPTDDTRPRRISGIPVTGVDRTLLDVAAVAPDRRVGSALDDALRRRLTTLLELTSMLDSLGPRGRTGSRTLSRLVAVRDQRAELLESPLESAVLGLLRDHGLPLPIPQHRVMDGGDPVARLDLAYPELRLGIEVDGYRWHAGHERWANDLRRENRLKLLGWTLLRFSWSDVTERPETVASQVRMALRSGERGSVPPTDDALLVDHRHGRRRGQRGGSPTRAPR
jgi:hypothetical protein